MKKIFLLVLFAIGLIAANAQNLIVGSSISPQTGCGFNVFDSGGENGDYFANRDDSLTIHSSDATHPAVKVEIPLNFFDIDNSDTLFIYDGTNMVDSMCLAKLNNSLVAVYGNITLSFAATMRSVTGELTLRLKTDGANNGRGFALVTSCIQLCQRVEINFDMNASNKFPVLDPTDGHYYINSCPYDTIHLVARGHYPDNDFNYHQSDQTSTFIWDLGDTTLEIVGGYVLDHYFEPGTGYDVSLLVIDSHGCESTNRKVFRVRTSANPVRQLLDLPEVCTGQTIEVPVGYDMISNIQLDTVSSTKITTLAVPDTIFLPDGIVCNGSCSYVSPVTFDAFSPTAKISSANDILFVRLAIEHSFIGDIWIRLTCPSGKWASLMRYGGTGSSNCNSNIPSSARGWQGNPGSGGSYFGWYYKPDDDDKCNPNVNPMGTCWNYCWSNNTDPALGYQYACGSGYVYESCNHISSNNPHGSSSSSYVDSTDVANMENVYHPDDNFFNSLHDCPLNGTWAIEVFDGWNYDNGYVCGWELALNPNLVPVNWGYDVVLDHLEMIGPGASGGHILATQAGEIAYTARIVDNLGCHFDTTMVLKVTQSPMPQLGPDTTACYGDVITLDPKYTSANTEYYWSNGDVTPTTNVVTDGDYSVFIMTSNDDHSLTCRGSDTVNVHFYPMPVADFTASAVEGCAPLSAKITNNSTPEGSRCEWKIMDVYGNDIMYYDQKDPVFNFDDPGTYHMVLFMTTPDGCTDTMIYWNYFTVYAQPIAEFLADPETSLLGESDGQVHFFNYADSTLLSDPNTSFLWNFGDGETDSTNFSPTHTYSQWGDYDVNLSITSGSGCSSDITHTVVIEQDLIFPNIITPNGDGSNDVFAIENLNTDINPEDPDGYRNNRLLVFDRWGKKVYEAKNYDTFSRDGQIQPGSQVFDGSNLNDGVYYFSFFYKGKAKTVTYNGSLTIIR
ncbi:MAG: gliding motility-associated C-terminal domain-containing protein [Bacteroidales bacterium]|nr:gliding motility-associated C-terminal domain-containing protein [Bacteroidales bacterium]